MNCTSWPLELVESCLKVLGTPKFEIKFFLMFYTFNQIRVNPKIIVSCWLFDICPVPDICYSRRRLSRTQGPVGGDRAPRTESVAYLHRITENIIPIFNSSNLERPSKSYFITRNFFAICNRPIKI